MIGIDIVALHLLLPRLEEARWRRLAFTPYELDASSQITGKRYMLVLAQIWGLKEAVVKANATGFSSGISPHDVVIAFDQIGAELKQPLPIGCPHKQEFLLTTSSADEVVISSCLIRPHECSSINDSAPKRYVDG